MNHTALRNSIEIVGITAVVISLVLVAYELRQNNDTLEAQSR